MASGGIEVLNGEPSATRQSLSSGCAYANPSTVVHLAPVDHPLWLSIVTFDDAGELRWSRTHGDEAVYVLEGTAWLDGRLCPRDGVVIAESAASASIRVDAGSRVAHFGPHDATPPSDGPYGCPDPAGHGVHLLGSDGRSATTTPDRTTRFYANSRCPTCRITLFYVGQSTSYRSPSHQHSQAELTLVLEGAIRVGRDVARTGSAVAIKADQRYGFQASPNWAFLNYRRDASYMIREPRSAPILEDGSASSAAAGDLTSKPMTGA